MRLAANSSRSTASYIFRALYGCVLVASTARAAKCPDGSDGLTRELYAAGDPSKYADVTCIPEYAFSSYLGNVTLGTGLSKLTSVESFAFNSFKGVLTFKGRFPLLATIEANAFYQPSDGSIELDGELAPQLTTIADNAFSSFKGTLLVRGAFPLLVRVGASAFESGGNADSKIELVDGLPALTSIEQFAFRNFEGTVSFPPGPYPSFVGCTRLDGPAASIVLTSPDHTPFTKELYEAAAGDASKYADVTCIPANEFRGYIEDVSIDTGLPALTSIGTSAFAESSGTLTIKGRFPLLASIGRAAFERASNANSVVELAEGLPALTSIGKNAFHAFGYQFGGTLTIKGRFPLLATIEEYTFQDAGNANSVIELLDGLPALTSIGRSAFSSFRGTLAIKGSFPLLATIGESAFHFVSNVDSGIELVDGLPALTSIGTSAFVEFSGTLTIKGRFPLLATIELGAFYNMANIGSLIELVDGLPALTSIGHSAFAKFSGTLTIKGSFPLLATIGGNAFHSVRNAGSAIELLNGLPALTSIGQSAFHAFGYQSGGTLTIKGGFPLLATIGESAFDSVGNANSAIELLDGLPALTSIEKNAFNAFSGTLTIKGSFPLLATIELGAFYNMENIGSLIEFIDGLPALTSIEGFAFFSFSGTLTIKGSFPLLAIIGESAFNLVSNVDSVIALVDGLPALTSIGHSAFNLFSGTLTIKGRFPLLATIELGAFYNMENIGSMIELVDGLPALTSIGTSAFAGFSGTLTIKGHFHLLATIGENAFNSVSNVDSGIEVDSVIALVDGLPALTSIGGGAFNAFSGTLTIKGGFPLLATIGESAFRFAGNAASVMELVDGHVPKLASIGDSAFGSFKGTLEITGRFPSLSKIGSQAFTSAGNPNATIDIACHAPSGLEIVGSGYVSLQGGRPTGEPIACCPDGSVGLTKELYAAGDPSKYADVTCIPRRAFQNYAGDVLLDTGLSKLKSVEYSAFNSVSGRLKFSGPFPRLAQIGERAFYKVNMVAGVSFSDATINIPSNVELADAPQLQRIKDNAFSLFVGTIVVTGAFPALNEIGENAFGLAGNADSNIAIACRSPSGLSVIPNSSFYSFAGAHDSSGENCPCDGACAPCWVPERPIDEMTCTTTTTTATTTTATTTTRVRYEYDRATGTPRDADADADAKRGAAATAGAIVGTLLVLVAIVAAVWHKRHTHAQSINRQFAARVSELAVDFFVANFAHLLVDAGEPNNLASGRAAHLLKSAALRAGLPSYKLIKGDTMGTGWYGTRYFATLRPTRPSSATISPKEVVAKVCGADYRDQNHGGADLQQKLQRFCVEALLIGSLEHPCILPIVRVEMSLLPFMVITERMQNGSLKDYLRACRPSAKNRRHKLAVEDLLGIGLSVVQACEFLEARKVVHRALMAENVLVGSNHTQIKLSGFSSLRDVLHTDEYIQRSDAKDTGLDIRFMAIESFAYNRFSVKSDVWAFGILMWEIVTLARKPYGAFNPSEIAAEVRSGRRLERVDACPLVLFEEMAKCWHEAPSTRPTFSELQGTLRLLLLEDADALRANVAAATKVSADSLSFLQWDVPVKGWDVVASSISDCGMFKLHSRRQGVHARLALATNNPNEAAVLKTVFCVLQNLTHEHLVPLLGCRSSGSAGTFSIFFDLPCSTSANAVTLDTILHTPFLERRRQGQQQSGSQRKEQPEQSSPLDVGYLTFDNGTLSGDTETDDAPLHTTTQGCLDLALQMTLAIEYVHANQIVHGRLSSRSFYSCDVGSSLRLLVGNALGATNFFSATSPVSHAAAAEAAVDAAGASGATAAIEATLPQNLRWLPYDVISGSGQGLATLATDVYSLGVLLWELFAARGDGGLPHSAAFPSDVDLWHAACTHESLPPLHMNLLMAPESILAIYAACTEPDSRSRPWVSGVASLLLDEFPCRWEKDRTQLEFVMNLGAGEFGQVVKMSTRMFSKGGEKDFVAVKMLSSGNGGAGAGAGSGGGYSEYSVGGGADVGNAGYSGYSAAGQSVGGGSSKIADVVESESADGCAGEAAKTLQADFLREVELMKQFRHPNLVQLLGVSTSTKPFMMILEFLKGGSLDQWLPENGPKLLKPTSAKLVHVLHQVALGMDALGNADIVHRDLAARNCLIDEHLHVKVADYGLSRDVDEDKNYYRIKSERPIPLRWTAPEMVTLLKVSASSDVFSFGVLAFEVFTFGAFPFNTIPDDSLFLNFLTGTISGRRMDVPPEPLHRPLVAEMTKVLAKHGVQSGPPAVIRALIQDCLIREPPTARPTFGEIVTRTRIGSAQQHQQLSPPGATAIAELPL